MMEGYSHSYQHLKRVLKADYNVIKRYEDIRRKLVRAINRRNFLLRCRSTKVFPDFIENWNHRGVQKLWKMKEYRRALLNFKVSVLNCEIRDSISCIKYLQKLLNFWTEKVININRSSFNPDRFLQYCNDKYEKFFVQVRNGLISKFDKILYRVLPKFTVQNTWLKNLSNVTIPNDVKYCLSLGNKFNFPGVFSKKELFSTIKNTETLINNSEEIEADALRQDVCNFVNKLAQERNNGSRYVSPTVIAFNRLRQKTKKFLEQHPELIVTNADKGNVTVIQLRDDYIRKAKELLSDDKVYKELRSDPTNKLVGENNKLIRSWYDKGMIKLSTKNLLTLNSAVPPRIYFLPKIHKNGTPYRPIVSSIDSPTYKLAKWYTSILSKVVGKLEGSVRNSFEFATKIKSKIVPENHTMLSLDAVSLYTSIPIDLALDIIKNKWIEIQPFCEQLSREEFLNGLRFCLSNTYFKFENLTYMQCFGCAMGCPVSSVIANIVMEALETECLSKLEHKPAFYGRYVDDIIMTYRSDGIETLLNTFNAYNNNIQFTYETELNNEISFLDVKIIKTPGTNNIRTDWYQKPTHSWRYINYLSNHPLSQKVNVLNNVVDRAIKLAHPVYRQVNLGKVKRAFITNGYPVSLINTCIKNRVHRFYNVVGNQTPNPEKYMSVPYANGDCIGFRKVFRKYDVGVAFSSTNSNSENFSKLKSKINAQTRAGVVYSIPCRDCDRVYVGNTSQVLRRRLTQHKSDTRLKPRSTGLAIHANDQKHEFDYNKTRILDMEGNNERRYISEMLHIQATYQHNVNKRSDTNNLSNFYKNTIEKYI